MLKTYLERIYGYYENFDKKNIKKYTYIFYVYVFVKTKYMIEDKCCKKKRKKKKMKKPLKFD